MLTYSGLTPTPNGDYEYHLILRQIHTTANGLQFNEKTVVNRVPNQTIALRLAYSEFTWHLRGEAEMFMHKCREAWDELTMAEAPVMARPYIQISFERIQSYIKWLYSDTAFVMQPTCQMFSRMQQHFIYILPPTSHQWHAELTQVLEQLTLLKDGMLRHIDQNISLFPTNI